MMDGMEAPKPDESMDVAKQIELRFKQSGGSRLAEYITGLRPDDPRMFQRLVDDQEIIRTKYGLPRREKRFDNPKEYEDDLRKLMRNHGVTIREKSDCGKYFKDHKTTAAAIKDKVNGVAIGVDMKTNDLNQYIQSVGNLEHEMIHALQTVSSPRMEIELDEYEAYVGGVSIEALRDNPQRIEETLFGGFIAGSVGWWYRDQSIERGEKIEPPWEKPEYFLKNVDRIGEAEIEKYKAEKVVVEASKE